MPSESGSKGKSDVAAVRAGNLLDTRRLFYFYHVARLGSVSAAEAILDVTQSGLTRQIQQLETELGEQLLRRTGRGMVLTAAGAILFRQAESILHDMAATVRLIEQHRMQEAGEQITIAFSPVFANTFMPDVTRRFIQQFPGVKLTCYEVDTNQVYDMLASGQTDLAIVIHEATSQKLALQKLYTEQLAAIVGARHPFAQRATITREELPELKLILPLSTHGTRVSIESYCAEAGIYLEPQLRFHSVSIIKAVLPDNEFCAILPQPLFAEEIKAGKLVALPLDPPLKRSIFLGRLRSRPVTPAMKALSQEIARTARTAAGS